MTPVEEAPQEGLLNAAKLRKRQRKQQKQRNKEKGGVCVARRPTQRRQLRKSQREKEITRSPCA